MFTYIMPHCLVFLWDSWVYKLVDLFFLCLLLLYLSLFAFSYSDELVFILFYVTIIPKMLVSFLWEIEKQWIGWEGKYRVEKK